MIAPGAISPFNRYVAGVGGAGITDFLYYDPDSAYVDNASITNRGTSGTDAVGYSGKSYDFDGISDFVDTGQVLSLGTGGFTDAFKISVWCKFDSSPDQACTVLSTLENNLELKGIEVFRYGSTTSNQIQFSIIRNNNNNSRILIRTNTTCPSDVWVLIECEYLGDADANTTTISFNGVVQPKTILADNLLGDYSSTETLKLGMRSGAASRFTNGQISDCSITINSVLTHQFEFNQASSTGIFDSVQGILATNSGCALIEELSGLENGETHNGIPQSFSKNWNRYDEFNGTDNYVIATASQFDPAADSQVVTIDFIPTTPSDMTANTIFSYRDELTEKIQIFVFNNLLYLQIRGSDNIQKEDTTAVALERVTGTLTYNGVAKTATLVTNIGTLSVSGWGTITASTKMTFGADDAGSGYVNFYEGLINNVTVNGNSYQNPNWTVQGTTPTKILIPENPSSLDNDIFDNAIVDPQPKFKLDGASYLEGEVLTIDPDTPFKFELDLVLYDLGTNGVIATNRNDANNDYGVFIYRSTDNKLNILILAATGGGARWVKTTTLPAINTSYSLKFEVTDITDINAYKIYIDDVEDTLTVVSNVNLMTTLDSIALSIGQDSDGTLKLNGSITNFKFNYL